MNGTAYSNFDKQEHVLKLGETFEKHPKSGYHTVRCKWDFESFGYVAMAFTVTLAKSSMLVSFVAKNSEGCCM